MVKIYSAFRKNIEIERLSLSRLIVAIDLDNIEYDNQLRSILVNSVSALDKYIHDFVINGILDIFSGNRTATKKYLTLNIPLDLAKGFAILNDDIQKIRLQEILENDFGNKSFQSSKNISDALSYITSKQHKWQIISNELNKDEDIIRVSLDSIIDRRNKIVHQYDVNLATNTRYSINREQVETSINTLQDIGMAVLACFASE